MAASWRAARPESAARASSASLTPPADSIRPIRRDASGHVSQYRVGNGVPSSSNGGTAITTGIPRGHRTIDDRPRGTRRRPDLGRDDARLIHPARSRPVTKSQNFSHQDRSSNWASAASSWRGSTPLPRTPRRSRSRRGEPSRAAHGRSARPPASVARLRSALRAWRSPRRGWRPVVGRSTWLRWASSWRNGKMPATVKAKAASRITARTMAHRCLRGLGAAAVSCRW